MKNRRQKRTNLRLNWATAANFRQLCAVNIGFVRGDLDCSPTHGPIDEETSEIVGHLIALNRRGVLTTCSQPAFESGRCRQRAFVQGFLLQATALRLAEKELYSDVLIRVFPPAPACVCPLIQVTQDDGHPCTWTGNAGWEELEHFADSCSATAMAELLQAWYFVAIDLKWGRRDLLWKELLAPRRRGYSSKPHPDLQLDDQEF